MESLNIESVILKNRWPMTAGITVLSLTHKPKFPTL
jgi:hypothetical protein